MLSVCRASVGTVVALSIWRSPQVLLSGGERGWSGKKVRGGWSWPQSAKTIHKEGYRGISRSPSASMAEANVALISFM